MDNLDLDIDNYSLEDLLNLFKISWNFSEEDLKKCKKMVHSTHPDKSHLDKKFFFFFKKAYTILYKIHESKQRGKSNQDNLLDETNKDFILKFKNSKNFNKIFNKIFEKNKLKDDECDDGYGDWLSSNDNCNTDKVSNMRDVNTIINSKKKDIRDLVEYKDFDMVNSSSQYNLDRDRPQYYSSDVFSKLNYEDLKKAHVESVVPVTEEDFYNRPHFNNEDELNCFRQQQTTHVPTVQESKEYFKNHDDSMNKEHVYRLYKLTRQSEQVEQINNRILGQFKQLTN